MWYFGLIAIFAGGLVAAPIPVGAEATTPRPNIIVFLADDLGFSDLGCYGGEIPTPSIDALAVEGLRFTQFYNTGRCSPTRASLMTGLYPHQVGVGLLGKDQGIAGYRGALQGQCTTIAELLRGAGYRTLMTGKWHIGRERPHWPTDRGFDRFYGSPRGGGFYFGPNPDRVVLADDRPVELDEDWHATSEFRDRAVEFLRTDVPEGQPFFLYVAFMAPHYPLQAPEESVSAHLGRYQAGWEETRRQRFARMVELGVGSARWPLLPATETRELWDSLPPVERRLVDRRMSVYAAQVAAMDAAVGTILEEVRALGREEDTLVFFLSDNGATAEGGLLGFSRGPDEIPIGDRGSYASYGLGWARVSNTPFQGFKTWLGEGGISSPLVVRWPRGIERRGALEDEPGHVIDILPTCLDAADVDYPADFREESLLPLEGRSLIPAFADQPVERDGLFWEHRGNRAVRIGQWKLSARHDERWRLYDLGADRTETTDVAPVFPEQVGRMARTYDEWARRIGVRPWEEVLRSGGN